MIVARTTNCSLASARTRCKVRGGTDSGSVSQWLRFQENACRRAHLEEAVKVNVGSAARVQTATECIDRIFEGGIFGNKV